jgi:multidrug efflux pump subunit AcrA (membrane-fusion protein)
VKEGQKIRKGDRLYELDTSKTTRSGVVSDNEFNEITSQLHGIDEIIRNLEKGETKHCSQLKIREINIRKHTISRLRLYELQSRDYKKWKTT